MRSAPVVRKKNAKALFEVITSAARRGRPLGVPGWFGQPKATAPAISPSAPEPSRLPASPGPAVGVPPAGPRQMPRSARAGEPALTVSGGRVRVSLNQVSATVAAIVAVVVVVTAFVMGRLTAPRLVESERPLPSGRQDVLDLGSGHPGVVPVPRPPEGQGVRPVGMVPDDAVREKGASYLVIQGGINTRPEAEDIKRFLHSKGVSATLHKGQTNRYLVKDMRPWRDVGSRQTRADLEQYIKRMEQLGSEYLRQGGDYDFRQNHNSPWLLQEK